MPARRFLAPLAAGVTLALASCVAAQDVPPADNPFAVDLEDVFGEQGPEPAEVQPLTEPENPAVRQWLDHARRGPGALGQAVAALARMGQWQHVDPLLSEAAAAERSEQELAAIAQPIEAAVLLRIAGRDELGEAARSLAHRLAGAATSQIESPDRLAAAIDQLGSDSIDQRLGAQRTLMRGGRGSVEALVEAVVEPTPPAPRERLLRVLLRLGEGGPRALRQLALYGTPPVQQRALEALASIDPQAFLPDLVTALHASDASESQRAVAASTLGRLAATLPRRDEVIRFLHGQLEQQRRAAGQTENTSATTTLWSVDEQRTGVQSQTTRAMLAAWRQAVDAAARVRRIGGLPPEVARDALLAEVGYRVVIDPDWGGGGDETEQLRAAYGPAAAGDRLAAAIDQALGDRDWPALVGLARLVRSDTPAPQRDALLRGASPEPAPLVRAAWAPDPRGRYEAAAAIARLDPQGPYPGVTRVEQTYAEMRSLSQQPTAILIETGVDRARRIETLLAQLGYRVEVVGSVQSLLAQVAAGGDVRLILATTDLPDAPPIELVDRVRRRDIGAEIPIAFYGDSERSLGAERWEGLTVRIPTPASVAGLSGVMARIEQTRQLPPLEPLDRRLYRQAVPETLRHSAGTGKTLFRVRSHRL